MAGKRTGIVLDLLTLVVGPVLMAAFFGRWREASGLMYDGEVDFHFLKLWDVGARTFTLWGPSPESLFVLGLGLLCWGIVRKVVWGRGR